MTIVGDLHGQLQDLFTIFTINGLPTPKNQYFFNGDFVDRGYYGVEIVLNFRIQALYLTVHMNRGNHECRQKCLHGFRGRSFVQVRRNGSR